MKFKLDQQKRRLESIFKLAESIEDEEVQAYFSKLLCILTSGLLENTIKNLVDELCAGTSPKGIQKFVSSQTRMITNLRYDRVLQVLNNFDSV